MKGILIYVFIFYSKAVIAQLPDDTLKNICSNSFRNQINNSSDFKKYSKEVSYEIESVRETFQGYFHNARIFLADCHYYSVANGFLIMSDHDTHTYQLYALAPETGKEIEIKDIEQFNNVFGQSAKLCNLDKCYLYLFLVAKTKDNINAPKDYRKALNNNSVFLNDDLPYYTSFSYGMLYRIDEIYPFSMTSHPQIEEDISRSTKSNIYIYTVFHKEVYRYHFNFLRGKIVNVVKTQLRYP